MKKTSNSTSSICHVPFFSAVTRFLQTCTSQPKLARYCTAVAVAFTMLSAAAEHDVEVDLWLRQPTMGVECKNARVLSIEYTFFILHVAKIISELLIVASNTVSVLLWDAVFNSQVVRINKDLHYGVCTTHWQLQDIKFNQNLVSFRTWTVKFKFNSNVLYLPL